MSKIESLEWNWWWSKFWVVVGIPLQFQLYLGVSVNDWLVSSIVQVLGVRIQMCVWVVVKNSVLLRLYVVDVAGNWVGFVLAWFIVRHSLEDHQVWNCCWKNCGQFVWLARIFLPSYNRVVVVLSDSRNGLWILERNFLVTCWFFGHVLDFNYTFTFIPS